MRAQFRIAGVNLWFCNTHVPKTKHLCWQMFLNYTCFTEDKTRRPSLWKVPHFWDFDFQGLRNLMSECLWGICVIFFLIFFPPIPSKQEQEWNNASKNKRRIPNWWYLGGFRLSSHRGDFTEGTFLKRWFTSWAPGENSLHLAQLKRFLYYFYSTEK